LSTLGNQQPRFFDCGRRAQPVAEPVAEIDDGAVAVLIHLREGQYMDPGATMHSSVAD